MRGPDALGVGSCMMTMLVLLLICVCSFTDAFHLPPHQLLPSRPQTLPHPQPHPQPQPQGQPQTVLRQYAGTEQLDASGAGGGDTLMQALVAGRISEEVFLYERDRQERERLLALFEKESSDDMKKQLLDLLMRKEGGMMMKAGGPKKGAKKAAPKKPLP
ncbi:unnamed protein product [Vitrella brassicaformis CCMP3155]|uniref:Uncharacterized protein n=2 Tax=Vitrella brassicaformis TaxID=1169539 RepID=A0A0G4FIA9_VITBC|nr:unnamed protein product [Vitrella brassicaformis CCMP3155]|mmetsp:Transcript_35566/g.88435  ORF Transcript_35566/g.88435 Transcript_35566/m.88435 type:complete len:160 (+) Transcript_35566:105-584(+)|eukprot:CEM12834.1 unnamed protein product [Vitrella brassicaformis CCMP3155]